MKVKKGFTLVELLVVIVILGVITGISIPLLRNIQERNAERKYTIYADAVTKSAKLYVDAYAEDLFGRKLSGCVYVTYDQLEEKNLLKDISEEDVSCNSENTFVRIVKLNNKYTYTTFLGCGEKGANNKAKTVTTTYPEKNHIYEINSEECGGATRSAVSLSAAVDTNYKKIHSTQLVITSPTGIKTNPMIYAVWRKDTNFSEVADSEWIRAQYQLPTEQRKKVETGETISTSSQNYVTPPNENGDYYLLVRVDQLEDLYEGKWTNPQQNNYKYMWFGPYKVDNTAPRCSVVKSNTGKTAGITATLTCEDDGSGCSNSNTLTYTKQKSSTTYKVYDNTGNEGTCPISITESNCNKHDCRCSNCYTGSNTCRPGTESRRFGSSQCPSGWTRESGGRDEDGFWSNCTRYSDCLTGSNTCQRGCDTCYDKCYS